MIRRVATLLVLAAASPVLAQPSGPLAPLRDTLEPAPFAVRVVTGEPAEPSRMNDDLVRRTFDAVRFGALTRNLQRLHATSDPGVRARLEAARADLRALGLEVVVTGDVLVERDGRTVRVSTGLLNRLHGHGAAVGERALALVLAHEAALASGLRGANLADAEAVRILEVAGAPGADVRGLGPTEVRAAVEAFQPVGAARVDGLFGRLRQLLTHGTPEARIERLTRAAAGAEVDGFAAWRRADGTLDWSRAARTEGGALLHFTLALFMKELAVVLRTGDRLRVEEFFDGLLTTDFYVHYGLFTVGARVGEVAFARYLQGFIRPRFVGELLRSNVALATGLALPELVAGRLEARTFALSLGALGLSSAAVKAGAGGVRGLVELARPARAARLAGAVGWVYTAAETAVVLYLAEHVEAQVRGWLDARAARRAVAGEVRDLLAVARLPDLLPDELEAALDAHHAAWTAYRDFFYTPLLVEDARLAARFERFAREAKLAADERAAVLARAAAQPALRRNLEERHGSLEGYARARAAEAERDLGRRIDDALAAHRAAHARLVGEVYAPGDGREYLGGVDRPAWHALGAVAGHPLDPWGARDDLAARLGRARARRAFDAALERPSSTRLGAYDDERRVLLVLSEALAARADLGEVVAAALDRVDQTEALDRGLVAPRPVASGEVGLVDAVAAPVRAAPRVRR
ncbi:MAG: hypothetical protein M9894_28535 [Planctomycetes bacterium]|nr:hypothetical protein [Planctomycetota bacterium]